MGESIMSHLIVITAFLFIISEFSNCIAQDCKLNEEKDWYYDNSLSNGPDHWGDNSPDCVSDSQSPIDIQTSDTVQVEDSDGLQLMNYDQPISDVVIENLGYTIKVTPLDDLERSVIVDGVPYYMKNFQFSWGNKSINDDEETISTPGSNHKIDGKQYAMEIQILHESENKDMVVIGVLLDDSDDSNPTIEAVQYPIDNYRNQGDKYEGNLGEDYDTSINISSLVQNDSSYFQYNGSLTQPPCTENVTWIILQNPSFVATTQLLKFEDLFSVKESEASEENEDCTIVNDFRRIQPLNNRIVYSG